MTDKSATGESVLDVSVPDGPRTYTSGRGYGSTFDVDVQGDNLEGVEKLTLQLKDQDIQGKLSIRFVGQGALLPTDVYVPTASTRVKLGIQVYRGPLHPGEMTDMDVTIQVADAESEAVFGEDTITLHG